tara:strand:+ start:2737 stop:3003 length:267 start_codon:yes stop_codon:yes gene_type:complete
MKVTISHRAVYHKIAEVEIEIPSNIELDDVSDYLMENEHLYVDRLDNKISVSEYEYGFGMGIGADWTDYDQPSETRFDIESEEFGGHL